jgi:hypothetical protein
MCICFKENIRKWYAKRSVKSYERYLENLDERLTKYEKFVRLKDSPLYETTELYKYQHF